MQEESRVIVGVDLGTFSTKVAVAKVDANKKISVVGASKILSAGMRKGSIEKLESVAKIIDDALGEAERMSGLEINEATININGSNVISNNVDGMIAISNSEVNQDDIDRIENVAILGKIPANREIVLSVPHEYSLDGQTGIKDPYGMSGSRLEMKASVVSALVPNIQNIERVAEMTKIRLNNITPSSIAAAKAVLTEKQIENGVAIVDFGSSTIGLSVYEDGDLKYTSVIPYGSNNITNDLAIGLKTTPEIAELIKIKYANATQLDVDKEVAVKYEEKNHAFNLSDINAIISARLDEMFDMVNKKIKDSGFCGKLPNGVVLVGGGSKIKNIDDFVQTKLDLTTKIGRIHDLVGIVDQVSDSEYVTVLGLMLQDLEHTRISNFKNDNHSSLLSKIFNIFKK